MAARRRRYNRFKFTEKKHSTKGIVLFLVALLMIILYMVFVGIAFHCENGVSVYLGSVGVLALVISFVSSVMTIPCFREENSFKLFPRLSLAASLLAFGLWGCTYILGFFIQ